MPMWAVAVAAAHTTISQARLRSWDDLVLVQKSLWDLSKTKIYSLSLWCENVMAERKLLQKHFGASLGKIDECK